MRTSHRRTLVSLALTLFSFGAPALAMTRAEIEAEIPDARLLWVDGGKIYHSTIGGWSPELVTPAGLTENRPRWKSDGTKIVYESGDSIWVMNADFSGRAKVIDNADTCDWTGDMDAVTAVNKANRHQVLRYRFSTGQVDVLHDEQDSGFSDFELDQSVELRKGGRYLITFTTELNHRSMIIDLQSKTYISNGLMDAGDCSPAWSPNGEYILTIRRQTHRNIWKANFNASAGTVGNSSYLIGYHNCHGMRVSNCGNYIVYGHVYIWKITTPPSSDQDGIYLCDGDKPSLYVPPAVTVEKPSVVTNAATSVTTASARLNGDVTSTGGQNPTVTVHWGDNDAGTGTWDHVVNLGTRGTGAFHADVSGLASEATYFFRCRAANSAGGTWGAVRSFTTQAASVGPVAHWTFDETSGTTAADVSGNGHTGQLVNMSGDEWTADGRIGGALSFADTDHVLIDPAVDLGAAWTFAAWIWAPVASATTWTSLTRAATVDHQILISHPSTELGTYENSGSGFNGASFMMSSLTPGWHHLAAVASGSQTDFYIDGAKVGTASYKSETDIGVIGNITSGAQRFCDKLDDVRLYERALSASEVGDLAAMGDSPPTNTAPTVNAGGDQTIDEGDAATLSGSASDDGLPTPPGALTVTWELVSGPGDVTFGDAHDATTWCAFSEPGTYVLSLTADDGELTASDETTVTVVAAQDFSVTVLSPAAGEVWYVGTVRRVEYLTVGIDDVAILYRSGGSGWQYVTDSLPASSPDWGCLPWTVPDAPSADCQITVSDYFGDYPAVSGTFTIAPVTDGDGDGMDDAWEVATFGDASHDSTTDADADGATDYEEFMNGTDPLSGDAVGIDDGAKAFSCAASHGASSSAARVALWLVALACVLRSRSRVRFARG